MIKIWFRFRDGREDPVPWTPIRMTLVRDADTPADSMTVVFTPGDKGISEEPVGIRMEKNGEPVFGGIIDEHTVSMEKGFREESFVCRSPAVLLLDSEAMPGALQMPSVRLMEKLFLQPLGLSAKGEDLAPKKGQLSIEPGTSCWTVLCDFAAQFLKSDLHCGRDGTVYFSAREKRELELPTLTKLTVTRKPAAQISRVVVQNAQTGAYSAVYTDPEAPFTRIRYLSARADTAPAEIFAEGKQQALQVEAVCTGYVDAEPGDRTDLSAWDERLPELEVVSVRYTAESGSGETALLLTACAE